MEEEIPDTVPAKADSPRAKRDTSSHRFLPPHTSTKGAHNPLATQGTSSTFSKETLEKK